MINILPFIKKYGEYYCTHNKAIFFYSLCKMFKPTKVLELGTGYGVSFFSMAQALKENKNGIIYSYDNGKLWNEKYNYVEFINNYIKEFNFNNVAHFINKDIFFNDINIKNIDLIFSDCYKDINYLKNLIDFFILKSSNKSSLFIDTLIDHSEGYKYVNDFFKLYSQNDNYSVLNIMNNDGHQQGLTWIYKND